MHNSKSQLLHPLLMFAVASFFYLYEFLLRVIPSVMKPELTQVYHIGAKEYGILAAIYYLSYATLQLPVGALIDKYGTRRLLSFAIILCAVSTLLSAYTHNFYLALTARFLIGAGSAFAFISCMKVLTVWFPANWFPVMTGLTLTIGTMGAAASWPLSHALNYIDWQTLLFILGLIGLVVGLLAWLIIRDENPVNAHLSAAQEAKEFWGSLKAVASKPQSWIVGIYAFLVTAPTDAFGGAWGVPFLTDSHGMDKDSASFAQSMVFVGIAVGSPLLGWVARKFNNRKIPMSFAAVVATLSLSYLIYSPTMSANLAAILFFTFGAFGTYVLAFVVIRIVIEDIYVGTAVGFVNMMSMIGSFILTSAIGWILDRVRSGAVNQDGLPIYAWADYKIGLATLPVFYAIASLVIVLFLVDRQKEES